MFDNGLAKASAKLVVPGFDVVQDMARDAPHWRHWQHLPGRPLELETRDGSWEAAPYQYEAKPLSAGTTIANAFYFQKHTAGADDNTTVSFLQDGRYVSCDGGKGKLSTERPDDSLLRTLSKQSGTYAIDGFMITLTYTWSRSDSTGSSPVTHSGPFFYVPEIGAVWIDDDYYPDEPIMPENFVCSLPSLPALASTQSPPMTQAPTTPPSSWQSATPATTTMPQQAVCGDGKRSGSELCDGSDVGNADCKLLFPGTGESRVTCTSACTFDTSLCSYAARPADSDACGNGSIGKNETCDGGNLNGATCASLRGAGYVGELRCSYNCNYDLTRCYPGP